MNGIANPNQHKIKIVFLGDSGVGKSSLISRFSRQQFNIQTKSTIGVEYATRQAEAYIKGVFSHVTLQMWDTAGQERFGAVVGSYFKNALGVVLVYDVTKQETLEALEKWNGLVNENCNEYVSKLVLGNKSDLVNLRKISYQQGLEFSAQHQAAFAETSSFTSINVDQSMELLLQRMLNPKIEIIVRLNSEQPGTADISRYSQNDRASRLSRNTDVGDREHTSCC